MSGTVRLLAIGSGAVLAALLYFVWDSRWYWAILAGVLALVAVPMLHERISGVSRRRDLKQVVERARDPDHDN
jgi:hypothetical protein